MNYQRSRESLLTQRIERERREREEYSRRSTEREMERRREREEYRREVIEREMERRRDRERFETDMDNIRQYYPRMEKLKKCGIPNEFPRRNDPSCSSFITNKRNGQGHLPRPPPPPPPSLVGGTINIHQKGLVHGTLVGGNIFDSLGQFATYLL